MGTNTKKFTIRYLRPPRSSREKEKLVHRFKNFFLSFLSDERSNFPCNDARDPSSFTQPPFPFFLSGYFYLAERSSYRKKKKKEIGNFERGKEERCKRGRAGQREREKKIGNIGIFPGIKIRILHCLNRGGFNETISRVFPTSMQLHDNGRA